MWQNSVQYAPDPTRGGAPGVGLACRLYLFGQKVDYPIRAEGSLVVDLLDETDGKSVHQEQWRFDPETVKKLVSKDFVGTGYTLFLPWSRYLPETSKVRLRVGFFAASGVAPIYTENAITLAEENGVIRDMNSPIGKMPGRMLGAPTGPMGVNESQPMRSPMLPAPTPLK